MARWLVLLLAVGCESIPFGSIGHECPNDNNCLPGLKCIDGECAMAPDSGIAPPRDAGQAGDAGPADADMIDMGVDAGIDPQDAGGDDAGPICPVPPELSEIQTRIFGASGQPQCDQASCHGQSAAGGLQLTLAVTQLRQALLGDTVDPTAPQQKLVVPGDPAQSRLYVIVSTRAPGGTGGPMPPVGPLDACSVATIRTWIENGAQ